MHESYISKKDAKEVSIPFLAGSAKAREYFGFDEEESALAEEMYSK